MPLDLSCINVTKIQNRVPDTIFKKPTFISTQGKYDIMGKKDSDSEIFSTNQQCAT